MTDFVTLTCPSCAGQLQITSDIDRFACGHCGTEHLVKRAGGIVALAPVVEGIKKVQIGVDKTAAELAIIRLEKEINGIKQKGNAINSKSKEATAYANRVGRIVGFFAGAITFVVFSDSLTVCFLSPGVGIGAYFLISKIGSGKKKSTEPLMQELVQKEKELAKHLAIVS
jgi:hypothetical protein